LVLLEQGAREQTAGLVRLLVLGVVAGLLVGLGGLTRYAFGWLILPVLLYLLLFSGPQRLVLAAAALVAFAAVMTSWLVRNYQVCGAPLGTAGYAVMEGAGLFPEHRLQRSIEPDVGPRVLKAFFSRALPQKLILNARQIVQSDLPRLGGGWVSAFFLVGLL